MSRERSERGPAPRPAPRRRRRAIAACLIFVIVIGLSSRLIGAGLPRWFSKDLGDVLWALMFFLIVVGISPRTSTRAAAACALAIASATEFLKLYHAPWIDALRGYRWGGMLLGVRFEWTNFLAYAVGASAAAAAETALRRRR